MSRIADGTGSSMHDLPTDDFVIGGKEWERAVVCVTIAGDPPTVHKMAHGWHNVSGVMPGFATELRKMVHALTSGKGGWHGRAAAELEKVVDQIIGDMSDLEQDTAQMAGNLTDAANVLADAVSKIPVPVFKDGGAGWTHWNRTFNVSHHLPGGTNMDDDGRMQAGVDSFITTLRTDYEGNKSAYQDFLRCALKEDADQLRSGEQRNDDYQGQYDAAADWYNANADIANGEFEKLKTNYTEHRGKYTFPASIDPLDLAVDPEPHKKTPAADYDPSSALTDWAGASHNGTAGAGGYTLGSYHSPSGSSGSSGYTPASYTPANNGPHSTSTGSELAGSSPGGVTDPWGSSGVGSAGVGTGSVGSAGGLGASSAGAGAAAVPPLTAAPSRLATAGTTGQAGTSGASGMGMMPSSNTGKNKRDERYTWLTEDEDYFAPDHRNLPRTNAFGVIE